MLGLRFRNILYFLKKNKKEIRTPDLEYFQGYFVEELM